MRRRSFVGLSLGLVGFSGCDGRSAESRLGGGDTTETSTSPPSTTTGTSEPYADLPYRAADGDPLDRPRGITLSNLGTAERFVTLVVADGDTEVFVDSRPVAEGGDLSFDGLVATAGSYEVLVETADGVRDTYRWEVTPRLAGLAVDVDSSLTFRRTAVCTPDCPPLAATDESAGVTSLDAVAGQRAVVVDNDTDAARTARLALAAGGTRLLDATYTVPSDVRLVVAVPADRFRLQVDVETETASRQYDWLSPRGDRLYVSLGESLRIRCTRRRKDLVVVNETDAARDVSIAIETDGQQTVDETVSLDADRRVTVPDAVPAAGTYRFVVETGERRETYLWSICPPEGPVTVGVRDEGIQVSVPPTLDG